MATTTAPTTGLPSGGPATHRSAPTGLALAWHRFKKSLSSPTPYLTVFGIFLWFFVYWLLCEGLQLPRFVKIPGPVTIISEWFSPNPSQGISVFVAEYYQHIAVSCRRIAIALQRQLRNDIGVAVPEGEGLFQEIAHFAVTRATSGSRSRAELGDGFSGLFFNFGDLRRQGLVGRTLAHSDLPLD